MLNFSFSTISLCVLTCNGLMVLFCFIFRNPKRIAEVGLKLLSIFLLLTGVRFLFPFEILGVTRNIYLPSCISFFGAEFQYPRLIVADLEISLWNIAEVLWFTVSLVLLCRFLFSICRFRKFLALAQSFDNAALKNRCLATVDTVCRELKKKNSFHVILLEQIDTPMVCLFHGPCILFPADLTLSDRELYFVLRHEMSHFFHHDLILKFFVNLLVIVYWWNPFSYVLKKQCDLLFEMRIDTAITNDCPELKIDYLHCILNIVKKDRLNSPFKSMVIPLSGTNPSSLTQRFQLLLSPVSNEGCPFYRKWMIYLLVVGIYIGSFFILFEASYMPDSIRQECTILTSENTYAVQNPDGTYDIYFENEYTETVSSLQYYPKDMDIY